MCGLAAAVICHTYMTRHVDFIIIKGVKETFTAFLNAIANAIYPNVGVGEASCYKVLSPTVWKRAGLGLLYSHSSKLSEPLPVK